MIALIVDDEKHNRVGLKLSIEQCCPSVHFILEADSADAARELMKSHKPDIIFLDINMPNENGFEFLNSIDAQRFAVVFVTAYSKFAVRAFKANAVDYLLKPVIEEELISAVEKCQQRFALLSNDQTPPDSFAPNLVNLKQTLESKGYPAKLTLPHHQGFTIVETDQIIHIEADGNYSVLYLSMQGKLVVTRAIREFEFLLDPAVFFRSHKSALINLRYVKEYSSADGHFVVMKNGERVVISRRRLDEFMMAIDKLSSRI